MWIWMLAVVAGMALIVAVYDVVQTKHAILRNFPIIGHFRYWLEAVGPELRQYIVTSNNEERPFSRDQRRWVYASSKNQNNYFGFGSDEAIEADSNYLIIKQAAFPKSDTTSPAHAEVDPDGVQRWHIPVAKLMGGARGRRHAFRPRSVVNISAMSFGSLSRAAVEALNRGAALCGCLHNTGEGGISPYHGHGGELVWQIGTGYFGCRDERGRFDVARFKENAARYPVRAIEIKLSQGCQAGLGWGAPGREDHPRDRRHQGNPRGQGLHQPIAALRLLRCGLVAGLRRALGHREWATGGNQVGRR